MRVELILILGAHICKRQYNLRLFHLLLFFVGDLDVQIKLSLCFLVLKRLCSHNYFLLIIFFFFQVLILEFFDKFSKLSIVRQLFIFINIPFSILVQISNNLGVHPRMSVETFYRFRSKKFHLWRKFFCCQTSQEIFITCEIYVLNTPSSYIYTKIQSRQLQILLLSVVSPLRLISPEPIFGIFNKIAQYLHSEYV